MKIFGKIYFLLLIIFIFCSPAESIERVDLDVGVKAQEHSQWCWAASAEAVLEYYLGNSPNQCDLANWVWQRNDCCQIPVEYKTWHTCNSPNYMFGTPGSTRNLLAAYGVNSNLYWGTLSWADSVNDIRARRPFIIVWNYLTGGGHDVVGYGYVIDGNYKYIDYMDPTPGAGFSTDSYEHVAGGAGTLYSWVETFRSFASPQTAQTASATSIYPSGATLNGTVDAGNLSTTAYFEYGTTTAYGNIVSADQSNSYGSIVSVSKVITGLAPSTTYHFRVKAVISGRTYYGSDKTFTTSSASASTLSITYSGTGTGHVDYSCGGIQFITLCIGSVDFLAVADPGSAFTGWSGDCSGTSATCKMLLTQNKTAYSVNASFTLLEPLTITKLGTGTGTITSIFPASPVINCGTICSTSFIPGVSVTLTATPDPGKIFTGWSGCDTASGKTCTITMTSPRTVTANFVPDITPVLNLLLQD